ncbi:hypothetical protein DK926_12920 [Rhodococcus sp. Eu-32]|uniref:hypothetical protein n=1 Tax=Rhodococcus sp. Eu-32 TaxID=1017319 RepID=UPI000DF4A194|nr:hypothetical protein [Rhodococcus sp. Eu-32]RRQ27392.1 hypothetical protein DK926_12920 [Rhodococcus sp. Eu-32]
MKLVYLHGVGSGDTSQAWFEALNEALIAQGMPAIGVEDVIAPQYSDLLTSPDTQESIPKPTVDSEKSDSSAERARFVNRQIEAARVVGVDPSAESLGFPLPDLNASDAKVAVALKAMPKKLFAEEIKQIQTYVDRKGSRGAVLRRVLAEIPQQGEIVVVGHSLGSVVTVDLLSRLPIDVSVRRVVTIGSPAHTGLFAVSRRELIGNFPYTRTNSWLNFFSSLDPVTRGRGLASVFADVQDVRVSVGGIGHGSAMYVAQPCVARAIGSAFHQPTSTPRRTTWVTTDLTDDTAALVLELNFRYAVADSITDRKVKARFIEAMRINRLDLIAWIREADDAGLPLPRELHMLADDRTPKVPNYWSKAEIIEQLTILAFSNLTTPFEIDVSDARFKALPDFVESIGMPPEFGETLSGALRSFQKKLAKLAKPGVNWQRWAIVGAGVAIPTVGLIVGATAMTGGLAALGPRGMAGGPAAIGGTATTGAAITTAAIVAGRRQDRRMSSDELLLAVAVAYTQESLGHDFDEDLWFKASAAEGELSAQINSIEALSDSKAPSVTAMVTERDMIHNLMQLMESNGLAPQDVPRITRT